jgi:Arc/MetJ family transcription regulator
LRATRIYGGATVTKTLIDIDDNLLAKAAQALGTGTKKDTVNAALAEVLRVRAANQFLRSARDGLYDDLLDPEVMKDAWRQ